MRETPVISAERWFPSHLQGIEAADCWELLAAHEVGRVAYCDGGVPVVLPVNYSVDQDRVLIQISPQSAPAEHLRDHPAAFQIDDFDDYNQSGWSVLVRGVARHVTPDDLPSDAARPQPWAEGQRTLLVQITPVEITGRRLLPA